MEMLDANEACAAEVFYSEVTGKMVVTLMKQGLPIEAVEELLSRARHWLPPRQKPEATTSAGEPSPVKPWPKCTASRSPGPAGASQDGVVG
jgi:hypothetical protein